MITLTLLVLLFAAELTCAQLTWKKLPVTGVSPQGRTDHAMGYDGVRNRVIMFGGRTGSVVYNDTWSYDITNSTWKQIITPSSATPESRFSTVYGVSNDYFYVSTGQEAANLYDDIWRFNLMTETWEKLNPTGKKPGTIYGAGGGFYTNTSTKFYLTHGFSQNLRYANTLVYDTVANTWTEIYPDKSSYSYGHPNARCLHSGTMVAEDLLLMYGGCLSGGQTGGACPAFDSWLFSTSKESWTHLEDCASPRTYSSLALLPMVGEQRRVVMFGGGEDNDEVLQVDKAEKDQVAIFNVNKENWELKRASGTAPEKRVGAAMIQHPEGVLMSGGMPGVTDIWILMGNSQGSDDTPKHSQTCKKPFAGIFNLIMLHGIFMVIGWGVFLQLGAFIARYFRHKNPLWFHLHRFFQISGLLLSLAGFICAVRSVRFDHFKFAHGGIGLFVMLVGILQPINAIIRPHVKPNEKKETKRKVWEAFHINLGRMALILAVINISLGLLLGQAREGHHIAWHSYVALFVLAYIIMEIRLIYKKVKVRSENMEMTRR